MDEQKVVAWDIEIAVPFPADKQWKKIRPLGISCASTVTSDGDARAWYGREKGHCDRMSPLEVRSLVRYLHQLETQGYTIVSWNGLQFDFDVLAEECNDSRWASACAEMAFAHTDMAFQMLCEKGFMAKLTAIAEGLGGEGKTEGMHGDLAPLLWNGLAGANEIQSEQIREMGLVPGSDAARALCVEYVIQDSKITLDVYNGLLDQGKVRWVGNNGRLVRAPGWVPASTGGRLLRVDECVKLPMPDTSWMKERKPMSRAGCYAWVEVAQATQAADVDWDEGGVDEVIVVEDDAAAEEAFAEAFEKLADHEEGPLDELPTAPTKGERMSTGGFKTLTGMTMAQVRAKLTAKLEEEGAYKAVPGAAGLTDIGPPWLWEALTDVFGMCGQGWWYTCGRAEMDIDPDANWNQKYSAFLPDLMLYYAYTEGGKFYESKGIPGYGAAAMSSPGYAARGAKTNALGDAAKMLLWQLSVYKGQVDPPGSAPRQERAPQQGSAPREQKQQGDGGFVESADPADWGDVGPVRAGDRDKEVKGGKHSGKTLGELEEGDKQEKWYLKNWIAKGWSYEPVRSAARRIVVAGLPAEEKPTGEKATPAAPSQKRAIEKLIKELGGADVNSQLRQKGLPELDKLTKVQAADVLVKLHRAKNKKGGAEKLPEEPEPEPEQPAIPF